MYSYVFFGIRLVRSQENKDLLVSQSLLCWVDYLNPLHNVFVGGGGDILDSPCQSLCLSVWLWMDSCLPYNFYIIDLNHVISGMAIAPMEKVCHI